MKCRYKQNRKAGLDDKFVLSTVYEMEVMLAMNEMISRVAGTDETDIGTLTTVSP